VKVLIAVTDNDWFRFLRGLSDVDEVNFWKPGGTQHVSLTLGQPLLFKLHAPENFIVGGGFFAHFSLLPSRVAWDAFGEKNGAASFEEMRRRIERYRHTPHDPHAEYTIGCVILSDPFFFDDRDWIPAPADFHPNIVQWKGYDITTGTGREVWDQVQVRLRGATRQVREPDSPMYGDPVLVRHRLGQGTFRVLVTDVYNRRCAVTGEKALLVLQAAHIRPVSAGGRHRLTNGLLLRSDVHTLFDRGYVTVTPDYRFRISPRLKKDFDDGETYERWAGATLGLPQRPEDRPDRIDLEWHADTVFRT
jgi:putative restriction endonuclease